MLIFQVLERDHNHIQHLLSEIKKYREEIVEDRTKALIPLVHELKDELFEIQEAEQNTVYKAVENIFQNNIDILCLWEEHHITFKLLEHSLEIFEKNDAVKGFAQLCIVANLLKIHFQYEKAFLFRILKDTFSSKELEKIGEAYEFFRIQNLPTAKYA